jgi:hypothetical protein
MIKLLSRYGGEWRSFSTMTKWILGFVVRAAWHIHKIYTTLS